VRCRDRSRHLRHRGRQRIDRRIDQRILDPARRGAVTGSGRTAHALRHSADLLTIAGLSGLTLTFNGDQITIQVGAELGQPPDRAAMAGHLAAIVGTRPRRRAGTGPTAGWIIADGVWAGHLVHVFTPIEDRS
jgi:hypothetical protein